MTAAEWCLHIVQGTRPMTHPFPGPEQTRPTNWGDSSPFDHTATAFDAACRDIATDQTTLPMTEQQPRPPNTAFSGTCVSRVIDLTANIIAE